MFVLYLSVMLFSIMAYSGDFNGDSYSKVNAVQRSWAKPLVEKIKAAIHTNILDIGCGTAEITAELAESFPAVTVRGIDPESSMLQWGKQTYARLANLQLIQAEVPSYFENCQSKIYSSIVSFSTLHWLSYVNLKKSMQGAHHALCEDGRCYFLFAGKRTDKQPDFLTSAVDAAMQQEPWRSIFSQENVTGLDDRLSTFTEEEFINLSHETNFTAEEVKLVKVEYTFPSIAHFNEWLTAVSPYKKLLGENHDSLMKTVIQEYLKLYPQGLDGSLLYPDYMIYAVLKKQS